MADFVSGGAERRGAGGGPEAHPPPPLVSWQSQARWCPNCLVLLEIGIRILDGGGFCPGCGSFWLDQIQFPSRAFDLSNRPCPSWHPKPCWRCVRSWKRGGK
jgi:hypothetical protein